MDIVRGAIENTVPISVFNKGLAGKIFSQVRNFGPKVVMKNNAAECVLVSPQAYIDIMDELNDARLLCAASERMAKYDPTTVLSQADVDAALGITAEDLLCAEEIEFE